MAEAKQSFGGKWTAEKLQRLRKYLHAYVQIMKRQTWCEYCYIDAFAGTGYNTPKDTEASEDSFAELLPEVASSETQAFLGSSVRLALETMPAFMRYVFIEKDQAKAAELAKLKADYPNLADRIEPRAGDANAEIQQICSTWNWRNRRAVLFLDPFGMQVTWDTIRAVAATNAIDMWLLFPAGIGVNRMLPKHGDIPEAWKRRLDAFLGVPESVWRPEFYKEETESDLFGTSSSTQKVATIKSIGRYFNERLKTVFEHVAPNPLELCNDSGTSLYLLCFAAKNATAVKIANDVLRP
jgi:three-Cys-motif partner protein